jgi:hypothetical protein
MLDTTDSNQTWEQLKLETINFKIELFGTGWDDVYPECIVSVNDIEKWRGNVVENTLLDIDVDIEDDSENQISIKYINRDIGHDVIRDAQGTIIKNKQIEISSISVDDIELDYYNILFSLGCTNYTDIHYYENFKLDPDKFPLVQYENTILGAEGTWSLSFTSPVYIWLLENI